MTGKLNDIMEHYGHQLGEHMTFTSCPTCEELIPSDENEQTWHLMCDDEQQGPGNCPDCGTTLKLLDSGLTYGPHAGSAYMGCPGCL